MKNQKLVLAAGAASMLAAITLLSACGNSSSSKQDNSSNKDFTVQRFVGLIGETIILNFQIS